MTCSTVVADAALGTPSSAQAMLHEAVFAAHAAAALASARKDKHLEAALSSRDVIGEAKGLLMARQDIGSDEPFAVPHKVSQRLSVKLRDIADGVVTGKV